LLTSEGRYGDIPGSPIMFTSRNLDETIPLKRPQIVTHGCTIYSHQPRQARNSNRSDVGKAIEGRVLRPLETGWRECQVVEPS
jgi:hypothetical protein